MEEAQQLVEQPAMPDIQTTELKTTLGGADYCLYYDTSADVYKRAVASSISTPTAPSFTTITGTLVTASQPNIETVGQLTSLDATQIQAQRLIQKGSAAISDTTVDIGANYITTGRQYTTTAAVKTGIVANYKAESDVSDLAGNFVAGVVGVSQPTVETVDSNVFAVGDICFISGSSSNDGYVEVLSHSGTTLQIRGVGVTAATDSFTRNQFTAEAAAGTIRKINVSVLQYNSGWYNAVGNSAPLTFQPIVRRWQYYAGMDDIRNWSTTNSGGVTYSNFALGQTKSYQTKNYANMTTNAWMKRQISGVPPGRYRIRYSGRGNGPTVTFALYDSNSAYNELTAPALLPHPINMYDNTPYSYKQFSFFTSSYAFETTGTLNMIIRGTAAGVSPNSVEVSLFYLEVLA